jgi:NADH dehydrogenase
MIMQAYSGYTNRCSVVTGAFGFSGQEITNLLLARGEAVRTLTNHPRSESPLAGRIEVHPLDFGNVDQLTESLRGASVVYNTYWVRFPDGELTHARAVANTKNLIRAAEAAGVRRLVHVSITKPSLESRLTYFRGKAELEEAIRNSTLTYAILRPAVLFGTGDILINNIAYMLKHFPAFMVPGDGHYRVQPIYVKDLAELAVDAGYRSDSYVMDAVGPETYTYLDLVKLIRSIIGSRAALVSTPATLVKLASSLLGYLVKDVVLTDQEIQGLMADLLVSDSAPTGRTSLREWIERHSSEVGRTYASELERHYLTAR